MDVYACSRYLFLSLTVMFGEKRRPSPSHIPLDEETGETCVSLMFASLILCLMEIMIVNSSGCLAFLDVAGTTERSKEIKTRPVQTKRTHRIQSEQEARRTRRKTGKGIRKRETEGRKGYSQSRRVLSQLKEYELLCSSRLLLLEFL